MLSMLFREKIGRKSLSIWKDNCTDKHQEVLLRWAMIFALSAVYVGSLLLLWRQSPEIAKENGLMENLQAASLAVGVLVSVVALARSRHLPARFILMAMALVMLGCYLREVDVEDLDLPALLIVLGSGAGRNLLLGASALAVLAVFVKNYRMLQPTVVAFLRHEACLPFYLGVCFYLAGELFDKRFFDISRESGFFFEELCENAATYFLALGTVWAVRMMDVKKSRATQ